MSITEYPRSRCTKWQIKNGFSPDQIANTKKKYWTLCIESIIIIFAIDHKTFVMHCTWKRNPKSEKRPMLTSYSTEWIPNTIKNGTLHEHTVKNQKHIQQWIQTQSFISNFHRIPWKYVHMVKNWIYSFSSFSNGLHISRAMNATFTLSYKFFFFLFFERK